MSDIRVIVQYTAQPGKAEPALMAITVDTEAERTYLKALARGLMLDDASVAQIHKTMGKPAL